MTDKKNITGFSPKDLFLGEQRVFLGEERTFPHEEDALVGEKLPG